MFLQQERYISKVRVVIVERLEAYSPSQNLNEKERSTVSGY